MNINISSVNSIGLYTYNQIDNIAKNTHKLYKFLSKNPQINETNFDKEVFDKTPPSPQIKDKEKNIVKTAIILYNSLNIIGYIPIIGTIVGIAKLIFVRLINIHLLKDLEKKDDIFSKALKSFRNGFKARAITETFSLGFILFIPDLIASLARSVALHKENKKQKIVSNPQTASVNVNQTSNYRNSIGLYTSSQIDNITKTLYKIERSRIKQVLINESETNKNTFDDTAFDQETRNVINKKDRKNEIKIGVIIYNSLNILGYLPIIGTIIGIAKLTFSLMIECSALDKNPSEHKKFILETYASLSQGFKARAIIETFSLGCILIIPDLVASVARSIA